MMSGDHGAKDSPWLQAGRMAFVGLYAITLLVALRWAFSNVREIDPASRAVVLRFGAQQRIANAGLLVAWPPPFEQVVMLPSADLVIERADAAMLSTMRIFDSEGATFVPSGNDASAGAGSQLTGDAGIVQLDVRVFYRVVDPYDYVLQGDHVLFALDRLVTRNALAVCASRDLDTILVARPELVGNSGNGAERRERLRGQLVERINASLAALKRRGAGIGIEVARVDVQSRLPRDAVSAFNAVLTASQQADENLAYARTDAARLSQEATQASDRILQEAQARASERLAKAQADTAAVLQLSQSIQGKSDPGLLMRIYRERIPAILSRAGSVTAVNPKDDARLILQGTTR